MKQIRIRKASWLFVKLLPIFVLVVIAPNVYAQEQQQQPSQTDAEAMQGRMTRARALTAAHKLQAAAAELDSIWNSAADEAVRDVARIMLMGILLEEGEYGRAEALLEDVYKARSAQNEASVRSYFALAGQAINGARTHLDRYQKFGIGFSDPTLPSEAVSDLDRLRALLERVAAQAKEVGGDNAKSIDAAALLEEVASVRGTLARDDEDRIRWQREVATARQTLTASENRAARPVAAMRRASTSSAPAGTTPTPAAVTAAAPPSNLVNSPAGSPNTSVPQEGAVTASRQSPPAAPEADTNASPPPANQGDSSGSSQSGAATTNAAQNEKPVDVGPLVNKATEKVAPNYPPTAKSARVMGEVRVFLEVNEKGEVAKVQSTTGHVLLRQAAIDAAKRWKFRPTVMGGQPVRVFGFVSFNFTL